MLTRRYRASLPGSLVLAVTIAVSGAVGLAVSFVAIPAVLPDAITGAAPCFAKGKDAEEQPAEKDFDVNFKSDDVVARLKAVDGLATVADPLKLKIIVGRVFPKEGRPDVLARATDVLARIKDPATQDALAKLARTAPTNQRVLLIESMSRMPESSAVTLSEPPSENLTGETETIVPEMPTNNWPSRSGSPVPVGMRSAPDVFARTGSPTKSSDAKNTGLMTGSASAAMAVASSVLTWIPQRRTTRPKRHRRYPAPASARPATWG